ncbi:MAG: hypothetical protein IPJ34_33930 [Myxococcales bacterium]|nr:hypothetical protein [Myxococcales bacterium]
MARAPPPARRDRAEASRHLRRAWVDQVRQPRVGRVGADADGVRPRRRAAVGELEPDGQVREGSDLALARGQPPARADGDEPPIQQRSPRVFDREPQLPPRDALEGWSVCAPGEEDIDARLRRGSIGGEPEASLVVVLERHVVEERQRLGEASVTTIDERERHLHHGREATLAARRREAHGVEGERVERVELHRRPGYREWPLDQPKSHVRSNDVQRCKAAPRDSSHSEHPLRCFRPRAR